MKKRVKKMIAPIIVTLIMLIYSVFYFGLFVNLIHGIWLVMLGVIPLAFAILIIAVCIQRILEIKKGEEDDISKY